MRFVQLTNEEKTSTGGFTHRLDMTFEDIPAGVAVNTAYTWSTAPLPAVAAGDIIKRTLVYLTTPFKASGDAAFNSTTISVGDTGSATKYVNAVQINENGTEVITSFPGTENQIYTAAGQLQIQFGSMAAKTLSNLNVGKLYVLFAVQRAADQSATKYPPFGSGYT
jgi:hypothetical protein